MQGISLVAAFAKKGSVALWSHFPDLNNVAAPATAGPQFSSFARLALPRSSSNRIAITFTVDDTVYISYPVFLGSGWLSVDTLPVKSSADVSHDRVVGFSVVIASNRQGATSLRDLKTVVQQVGETLLLQEHIADFMSSQILLIVASSAGDDGDAGKSTSVSVAAAAAGSGSASCELTALLARIAEELCRSGTVHLEMPHSLPLSLSLVQQSPQTEQPLRPYHSLLLLRDPDDILDQLPGDASPQLVAALHKASPTRSIHELQAESGLPSSQLLRIAGHLVHHGLATIVDTISEESRFSVSAGALPDAGDTEEFKRLFGAELQLASSGAALGGGGTAVAAASASTDLGSFLFLFSKTAAEGLPLRVLMADMQPSLREVFVQCLAWLLKRGHLVQQHSYVHLLWPWVLVVRPPPHPRRHHLDDPPAAAAAGSDGPDEHTNEYEEWQPDEAEYAAHLCKGKSPELVHLFTRVLVYLRDVQIAMRQDPDSPAFLLACRVEELMYRLRVLRADLQSVFTAFSEVMVISTSE